MPYLLKTTCNKQVRRFRFEFCRNGGLWLKDMWRPQSTVLYYNVKPPHVLAKFLQATNRTDWAEQEL